MISKNLKHCYDLLKDKRVAIVGGGFKGVVDLWGFDLVWWVNNHWREGFPIHGLFTISALEPKEDLPALEVLHVQYPAGNVARNHYQKWQKVPAVARFSYCCYEHKQELCPHGTDQILWQRLHNELDTRPFTGISAIAWLLTQPLRELYITGYDFYRRGDRLPWRVGPHHIKPQVEWMRRQRTIDPRVRLDAALEELCPPIPKRSRVVYIRETDGYTVWAADEGELGAA